MRIRFKDYLIDYLDYHNISNKDFAGRIDISPKHLGEILSGKKDISSSIAEKISLITDIPINFIYEAEKNYKMEKEIEEYLEKEGLTESKYLDKFKYREVINNKYIPITDEGSKLEIIKDILKYLRVFSPNKVSTIDAGAYYKSKNDRPELLLLWLEKCYRETLKQEVKNYDKSNIEKLVKYIASKAKKEEFDEEELIKEFNKKGIFLVIEDDLPGTKVRGAFRVHKDKPAIYLTHRHKRLADIYFALLHELAHCKTDFNEAKNHSIVSLDDSKYAEEKADMQAFNWMVDNKYYNKNCVCKGYDIEEEKKYPQCFVAYRLANDKIIKYSSNIFQKYNKLHEF